MKQQVPASCIQESESAKNEYILSIQCPVCGHDVVYLPFPRSFDDEKEQDELVESVCAHTIYLNNYQEGILSHPYQHELLKEWVIENMKEEGEDEEAIAECQEDELFDDALEFGYAMYLGDQEAETLCNFLSEKHPDQKFYYADTSHLLGTPDCGAVIAYSVAFAE